MTSCPGPRANSGSHPAASDWRVIFIEDVRSITVIGGRQPQRDCGEKSTCRHCVHVTDFRGCSVRAVRAFLNSADTQSDTGLAFCQRARHQSERLNFSSDSHDSFIRARSRRYSAIAWRVYAPWRNAFWLPGGAPEPGAPPCIRQRRFPRTAGDLQGCPDLVLAPQLDAHGAKFIKSGSNVFGVETEGAPTSALAIRDGGVCGSDHYINEGYLRNSGRENEFSRISIALRRPWRLPGAIVRHAK